MDVPNNVFTLNICGNVVQKPKNCQGRPDDGMAWMTSSNASDTSCYKLAGDFNSKLIPISYTLFGAHLPHIIRLAFHLSPPPTLPSLCLVGLRVVRADSEEPAKGFSMRLFGGDSANCGKSRSITLVFLCNSMSFPPPGKVDQTFVEELDPCTYQVFLPSTYGCPLQCPTSASNALVCSNQGICRYDTDLSNARCFCDDGYVEKDCSSPKDKTPTGAIVGAVFGGIILGLAVVAVYYYFNHVQRRSREEFTEGYYDVPEN